MKEIWKDIKGYEGLYQVSNYGRVKSLPRKRFNGKGYCYTKEKILATAENGKGYLTVSLHNNDKGKKHYIHRLVAQAFIGDIPKGYEVNHIDFDRSNNHLSNLEIVTQLENNQHSIKAGRRDGVQAKAKTVKIVYTNGEVAIYNSVNKASKDIGVSRKAIDGIALGKYSGQIIKKKYNIESITIEN